MNLLIKVMILVLIASCNKEEAYTNVPKCQSIEFIADAIKSCKPIKCEWNYGFDKSVQKQHILYTHVESNEVCRIEQRSTVSGFAETTFKDKSLLPIQAQIFLYGSQMTDLFVMYDLNNKEEKEKFKEAYRSFKGDFKKLGAILESKEGNGVEFELDENRLYQKK